MIRAGAALLALSAFMSAPAALVAPPCAAADRVQVRTSEGRISLATAAAKPHEIRDSLESRAGIRIFLPDIPEEPIPLSFDSLSPREAAGSLGAALGGLVPVQVSLSAPGGAAPRHELYLVRAGSRSRRLIEAYTLSGSGRGHRLLFEAVRAEGASAVPEIVAHVGDPELDEARRTLAIKLLGAVGGPAAVAELSGVLRSDRRPLSREAAAIALGWIDLPSAVPALRRALEDPEPGVALTAAWALARHGDRSGMPLALDSLGHSRTDVALRAIEVIEASGDEDQLPALEGVAAGAKEPVRVRARAAAHSIRMARLAGAERISACERLLADPDPATRRYAAATLGAAEDAAAAAVLSRAAGDSTHPGRREAAEAARRREADNPRGSVSLE